MKRAHDDISAPVNGDAPTEASAARVGGDDDAVVKSEGPTTATAASSVGGAAADSRRKCPYLDTINRNVLDFDFEKVCNFAAERTIVVCGISITTVL